MHHVMEVHYDVTRVRIIQEHCKDDPEKELMELLTYVTIS